VKQPSLLIITAKASAVRGAAAFLSRRDIPTYVATSMNEALNHLSEKKPDMVLISVNYPHQKMESFPMLLEQSFGVETILFAETHDRKTAAKLQNIKATHSIHGIISGPAVLMKLRQIEHARNTALEDARSSVPGQEQASEKAEGPDAIVFRGERAQMKEAAMGDLLKALSQEKSAGGERESDNPSATSEGSSGEMMSAVSENSMTPGKTLDPSANASGTEFSASEGSTANSPSSDSPGPTHRTKDAKRSNKTANDSGSGFESFMDQDRKEKKPATLPNYGTVSTRGAAKAPIGSIEKERKNENEDVERRKEKLSNQLPNPTSEKLSTEAAKSFWTYVTLSLATICHEIPDSVSIPVVGAADLFLIQSKTIRGACIIVVSDGADRRELIDRFQVAYFSHLRAAGIEISSEEQVIVALDDKALAATVFASADVRTGANGVHSTVGAAMVEVTSVQPKVESAGDRMLKISLADLPVEHPTSYEVFLHLPKNKKFLRYLKSGGKISEDQMERLQKNKVQHVFLNEEEEDAYRRQFAQRAIRTG
jgi:hypothetical protein